MVDSGFPKGGGGSPYGIPNPVVTECKLTESPVRPRGPSGPGNPMSPGMPGIPGIPCKQELNS